MDEILPSCKNVQDLSHGSNLMYIFVYGTLKHGGGLNFKLDNGKFIGAYRTQPKYTLFDVGHPCLTTGGTTRVLGDLYEVEDLAQIIQVHNMETRAGYRLERVHLQGFRRKAFAYMQVPEEAWAPKVIASGDWVSHLRKKNRRLVSV